MKLPTQKNGYIKIADQLTVNLRAQHKQGDMLPSENQLSKKFDVTRTTIRRALDVLEDQGLIQRFHRRGAVVTDPLLQGEFAVVMKPDLMKTGSSPFYREAAALLTEKICTCNNNKWSAKLHLGQQTDRGVDFPATLDLLEPDVVKRLRGVFTFNPLFQLGESLAKKNIPVLKVGLGGKEDDSAYGAIIIPDKERFYSEASQHLRMAGCKTVGFMWYHWDRDLRPLEKSDSIFARCAIDAGLSVQEKWMPAVFNDITETKAYETFMKFWEQGDIPDGLVIDDDILASGVLRAILHKRIQVPEQIRLVSFANETTELPWHRPVTRYEFNISDTIDTAVEAMVKLVEGKELESKRIFVPGKLINGTTT